MNRLIVAAQQMGFMDSLFDKNVANSTKCTSWKQVQESHTISNQDIGLKLKDLRGYAIALASGLSAAIFMFIAENMMQWCMAFDEVVTAMTLNICPALILFIICRTRHQVMCKR